MTTFYEILGIPEALRNAPSLSAQRIRSAYRRALLQNHPDKSKLPINSSLNAAEEPYSIDEISEAFSTLSNPKLRSAYDKELKLRSANLQVGQRDGSQAFRTGIEIVDLDDLDIDEANGTWYRSCRCGDGFGFLIREGDLEEAAGDGELSVACKGCSLWLKVLFGVVDDGTRHETTAITGTEETSKKVPTDST